MQRIIQQIGMLIIGLLIGGGLGLLISWVLWPTEFSDANPAVLERPYQETYIQMVADAYATDQDLEAATQRLLELGNGYETPIINTVNNQLLQNGDQTALRRIAFLANDLGLSSPAITPLLNTGDTP